MKKLQDLMDEIMEWSDSTFGDDQRTPGMVAHLVKEVLELKQDIDCLWESPGNENWQLAVDEIADCMMLLLDISSHIGLKSDMLLKEIKKKLDINKTRQWGKSNVDGSVEHLRDEESN